MKKILYYSKILKVSKHLFLLTAILFTSACSGSKDSKTIISFNSKESNEVAENNEAYNYVEAIAGFADTTLYGEKITKKEYIGNSVNTTYEYSLKDDSHDGAVFFKEIERELNNNGLLWVYLSGDTDGISLNVTYDDSYTASIGSHIYTSTISMPDIKNRCYAVVQNNYLVTLELCEDENVSDPDMLIYEETLTAYDLNNDFNKEFEITRYIEPKTTKELKNYKIIHGSSEYIYAYGYGSYINDRAEFLSTEQEFCDKANSLLNNISVGCIEFNFSSWNNRWYGTSVDESYIDEDMVKVDFTTSEPQTNEEGYEITEITITVNGEKQELSDGEALEEIEDNPVTYNHSREDEQEKIIIPNNIPSSIDVSALQDLRYFDIDGFWYSDDYRYVYHIYTKSPDNGFGTLYFADLEVSDEALHGQVKQTSSYSVILKAMLDNAFSPEVFAVGNQLKSDQLTLTKVNPQIVQNLLGTWSNEDISYTFKNDGKYSIKTSNDFYWGYYFAIDETHIVLGEYSDELKFYDYNINGSTITIENLILKR